MTTMSELRAVRVGDVFGAVPCPDWCTLTPGHPASLDHVDGRTSRGHGGANFGRFLDAGADEFSDDPGRLAHVVQLHADAENITDPADLRLLAHHAEQAADWLEAQR